MQLASLHSKTNYSKCFGLFWLNYQDTNNYLTSISGLLEWLAYKMWTKSGKCTVLVLSAALRISVRVDNTECNFWLLIQSTSCSALRGFSPFTQMSETKQKKYEGCSHTAELLIEPFHITCTRFTRGFRQHIKLRETENLEKHFTEKLMM